VTQPLIEVRGLQKQYRHGFWMRRVEAVRGIDFEVPEHAFFGFLGPNGAGKTTTIKVLMGLTRATGGEVRLFGHPVPAPRSRARLGFMPENPYVYPYLTPREFVRMNARLSGLGAAAAASRTQAVLSQVGIAYAADRPARRLSKGMLQRTGLAAALVSDPELLVLDEPMSGLDPVGRREVRDLLSQERARGRTLLMCTHILADVPLLCDRIVIVQRGRVVVSGRLEELLRQEVSHIEVRIQGGADALAGIEGWGRVPEHALACQAGAESSVLELRVANAARLTDLLSQALGLGANVLSVTPRYPTLEDLFLRHAVAEAPESADSPAR
jgi:ABC-2 type transport system ATP-binding protein